MSYAITFTLFAVALAWTAFQHGGVAYALLWPGGSSLLIAMAYAGLGPAIFGKQLNGRRYLWATLLLGPYLALSWAIWSLRRRIVADPCATQISPGIWLGRRPYLHELPPSVRCVVDLTCEFTVAKGIREKCRCICLPTLDTETPIPETLVAAVRQVAACPDEALIHCAAGHGRSAMFAAALLLARGLAPNPEQALQRIRSARPGIHLSPRQERLLEQVQARLAPNIIPVTAPVPPG